MDDIETPSQKSTQEALEAWNAWQPETDSERQLKERFDLNKAMELVIGMQECIDDLVRTKTKRRTTSERAV